MKMQAKNCCAAKKIFKPLKNKYLLY